MSLRNAVSMVLLPVLLGYPALLAGCSDERADPSGTFAEGRCPFSVAAGMSVTCGALTVPENYAQPDVQTIELSVAIFKSTSAAPESDPLVYLSGGPGVGAVAALASFYPALGPVLAQRDMIAIDQRGTGFSRPALTCPELDAVADPSKLAHAVAACRDRLTDEEDVDLSQYTTANNARDVRALRKALGLATWNVVGSSYGTRLALEMMRQDSASLRAVILDSTLAPDLDALGQTARAAERSFEQVFDACSADAACAQQFPDLKPRFYALLAKLDESPLEGKDSLGNQVTLNGARFTSLVGALLYDVGGIVLIPAIVAEAEGASTATLDAVHLLDPMGNGGVATAMNFSVVCAEFVPLTSAEKVVEAEEGVQPEIAAIFNPAPYLAACPIWNVPAAPRDQSAPVKSDLPALVLAGAFDPSTPPSWGEHVAQTLDHAHYSLFQGATHGVVLTGCGMQMMADFLDDPAAIQDPTCVERETSSLWTLAMQASQAPSSP